MKFQLLQIGQRFEFEGKVYVKTGPVAASEEATGKQRMIPRYAVLKVFDATAAEAPKARRSALEKDDVVLLFDAFYRECVDIASSNEGALDRLQAARQRFLDAL